MPRAVAWLTGRLAAPALEHMADDWRDWAGWRPHVETVDNSFFGREVTVSGLLSGSDFRHDTNETPRAAQHETRSHVVIIYNVPVSVCSAASATR